METPIENTAAPSVDVPRIVRRFGSSQQEEFNVVTEPVKQWMRENCDPYDLVIIDQFTAKLHGMELSNYNGELK